MARPPVPRRAAGPARHRAAGPWNQARDAAQHTGDHVNRGGPNVPRSSDTLLTLVIDIGKTHARLLLVDPHGALVEQHRRANASASSPLGYPALDLQGLAAWIVATLAASDRSGQCAHVIASTHGAAVVALAGTGTVAWDPLDYEFDPFADADEAPAPGLPAGQALARAYALTRDPFAQTLAPDLPAGLNMARQLYWMQHRHPQAWARTTDLLPYPQYWAWWLSGVRASECSSLGCHTQLWLPASGSFSALAQTQGWAGLFAPLRQAWDTLGPVRPELARRCGLPRDCQVHVGVHDSNACLARYLQPGTQGSTRATAPTDALTLVSSGTWTVLMAPGAPLGALDAQSDMLANVDVFGRATPTARFMGGRDFAALLHGAPAQAGSATALAQLIGAGIMALPAPAGRSGDGPWLQRAGQPMRAGEHGRMPASQRASLATLYCALMTATRVERLWHGTPVDGRRMIVEGPLATNPLYLALLQGLLPGHRCLANPDPLEGTAAGAAALCGWTQPGRCMLQPVSACALPGLEDYRRAWLAAC